MKKLNLISIILRRVFGICMLALVALSARAELNIFACEPEWAALAKEIGGEQVSVYSATTAMQDPHYIQARPSLIARVRKADIVICSGAELEIGWLPLLLQKANNPRVVPGKLGYLEASSLVERIDVNGNIDRALGDIHPLGNPHVHTNPHNINIIATVLSQRMAQLDAAHADVYQTRRSDFSNSWIKAIDNWEALAVPLKDKRVITHHNSWVYLARWLGIDVVANLEAVPGLPPTAKHLSNLLTKLEDQRADCIIRSPFQNARASKWLEKRTDIPALELPLTVGASDEVESLFDLFDEIIERLLKVTE